MTDNKRAFAYLTGTLTGGNRPDAVGRKFDTAGAPLTCRGNTALCHVDPQGKAFAALVAAQNALRAGPLAEGFAFLPPDSFHMTIFEGVIDYVRSPDRWPGHLPPDASVDGVTADFSERLRRTGLARRLTIRPTGIFGGFSVRMTGADAGQEALLRQTRDQLQAATNLVRPDHADYAFHITLAYPLRWFTAKEARAIIALSDEIGSALIGRAPQIALGPVEFCAFDTMNRFETLQVID